MDLNSIRWCESRAQEGITVAADRNAEWLLPWWWEHYTEHNQLPVHFVDFGMSTEARSFCMRRGTLDRPALDADFENPCLRKPFAILSSPFLRNLWIDLDCEVRGPINEIFSIADCDLVIREDIQSYRDQFRQLYPTERFYQGGVYRIQHGSSIMIEIAKACLMMRGWVNSEQPIISRVVYTNPDRWTIRELPRKFNNVRQEPELSDAVIRHWTGAQGKAYIRNTTAVLV